MNSASKPMVARYNEVLTRIEGQIDSVKKEQRHCRMWIFLLLEHQEAGDRRVFIVFLRHIKCIHKA